MLCVYIYIYICIAIDYSDIYRNSAMHKYLYFTDAILQMLIAHSHIVDVKMGFV